MMDSTTKMLIHCDTVVKIANSMLETVRRATENKVADIMPLYISECDLIRNIVCGSGQSILKRTSQSWGKYRRMQGRQLGGCEHLSYEESLKNLGLFSFETEVS